jgi:hypothetical protein
VPAWLTGTQAGFRESDLADISAILYGRSNHVPHGAPLRPEFDRWGQVANLELAWKRAEHLAHIARHDPARVLAEVVAKRRILDLFTPPVSEWGSETLRLYGLAQLLALPYADRPGYREEWRP